jgi:NlpC/P60 family putative phage cell wall peptidase
MMQTGSSVVLTARKWIGTPYVHQASVRGGGTDCLGLLRGVWRDLLGDEPMAIPPYSADWSEVSGREALLAAAQQCLLPAVGADVQSGDVLLFRMRNGAVAKHLGIAAAVGRCATFIHAYTGHGVVESPLSEPWTRRIVARFRFPCADTDA